MGAVNLPDEVFLLKTKPNQNVLNKIHNQRCMTHYTIASTIFVSICQWSLFDAYLAILSQSKGYTYTNSWVGLAESISGIFALILAAPVGVMVDKYSRVKICKWSAILGLVASVLTFYTFLFDSLMGLVCNLVVWAIHGEFASSATQAIFADSLDRGNRSESMTINGMIATAGLALGPLALACLFKLHGNHWTLSELHAPLLAGTCIAPITCYLLYNFKSVIPDDDNDDNDDDNSNHEVQSGEATGSTVASTADWDVRDPKKAVHGAEWSVPYFIATSDFVRKVGAGMTVKFFALFFIKDYRFTPLGVSVLFGIYPLAISLFMRFVKDVSEYMGRVRAVCLWQTLGIGCLLVMIYATNLSLLVFTFILRGAFSNGVYPLDRSIMMDYVTSKNRGKWNAVESLTSMTWSGSAILGGFLVDTHDYRFTFQITAIIYTISLIIYLPLLYILPSNRDCQR